MSTDPRRQLDHDLRQLQQALDELILRAHPVIDRDHRGGERIADGYPSTSIGAGTTSTFTVDSTSSTANAAHTRIGPLYDDTKRTTTNDDMNRCARGISEHLDRAVKHLHSAVGMVALAEHISNPDGRHSNPPTNCRACDRVVECTTADPIRAGYCGECSDAWYRHRKAELTAGREPDRVKFERQRAERAKAKRGAA